MPMSATISGAKLVIITLSSTPMDEQATGIIRAKAGEAMQVIVQQVTERISR